MKSLDSGSFEQEVLGSPRPSLVDFWSPNCQPCLQLMPTVEELERKFGSRVSFFKVNTAENRRLAVNQRIMGLPTIAIYADGEKKSQLSGEISQDQIEAELSKHLGV